MPLDDKMVFPGWSGALGGMKIGSIRKIWAPAGSEISRQLRNPESPIVLEIKLNGIDEFITLPETLPGAEVGEVVMEASETGLGWYDVTEGEGDSPRGHGQGTGALHRLAGGRHEVRLLG